jgi:hypothetical protein
MSSAETVGFGVLILCRSGAPEKIRTPDPQIRSLMLYPAELRALCANGAGDVPRPASAAADLAGASNAAEAGGQLLDDGFLDQAPDLPGHQPSTSSRLCLAAFVATDNRAVSRQSSIQRSSTLRSFRTSASLAICGSTWTFVTRAARGQAPGAHCGVPLSRSLPRTRCSTRWPEQRPACSLLLRRE